MNGRSSGNQWLWYVASVLLVVVVALGLRYGTNILRRASAFDERHIRVPIDALVSRGWSVETAIDFTETKGPTLIWTYAFAARWLGSELNDYRLLSVIFFAAGVIPLLLLCRQCGLTGAALPAAAGFYVLLPHNAVLGQLLMSEPLFMFGSLWLTWAFVWGFGTSRQSQHGVLGPILFGVILAILLHLRLHAVAMAGAAALVAVERDRARAWPWVLACAVAGLSRLPLWIRWGGAVAPEYQSMHGLGLNPDAITYLAAAWVPLTAVFLIPTMSVPRYRWWMLGGGAAGLAMALFASPLLTDTMTFGDLQLRRYQGFVASSVRAISDAPAVQSILLGGLAVVGAASVAALAAMGWERPMTDRRAVVVRLAVWMLAGGACLYALTRAYVFDRYLLAWVFLLPIIWIFALPKKSRAVEALILLGIFAWLTWRLLINVPA